MLALDGKALEICQSCKERTGKDAWALLLREHGKLLEGDRVMFQRRLAAGEVTLGQQGMLPGGSVKAFIRDLDHLHSALYAVCDDKTRPLVPELSDHNMKQVLLERVPDDLLGIITNYDASKGNTATYSELCTKLIAHENLMNWIVSAIKQVIAIDT